MTDLHAELINKWMRDRKVASKIIAYVDTPKMTPELKWELLHKTSGIERKLANRVFEDNWYQEGVEAHEAKKDEVKYVRDERGVWTIKLIKMVSALI